MNSLDDFTTILVLLTLRWSQIRVFSSRQGPVHEFNIGKCYARVKRLRREISNVIESEKLAIFFCVHFFDIFERFSRCGGYVQIPWDRRRDVSSVRPVKAGEDLAIFSWLPERKISMIWRGTVRFLNVRFLCLILKPPMSSATWTRYAGVSVYSSTCWN